MRSHKKTKESGFFEGEFETDINMGKALKRTNVFTTSSDYKRRTSERLEYTSEELETHIRPRYNSRGITIFITYYCISILILMHKLNFDKQFSYCFNAQFY